MPKKDGHGPNRNHEHCQDHGKKHHHNHKGECCQDEKQSLEALSTRISELEKRITALEQSN